MLDRLIRAFLVVVGVSVACAWTWPGAFPEADPVAVLVRYHTPNVYRAVVAWHYVAPGVAVLLAGQFLISTSRIWFARMGVGLGLRARLPRRPLSPTADGPAIVVGEVHHPVKLVESATPDWLMIPERGLYTGVAILGAVGSGKTSACMHPFARQLLSWHATNPGVQRSRRTSAPLTSRTRSSRARGDGRTPIGIYVLCLWHIKQLFAIVYTGRYILGRVASGLSGRSPPCAWGG